MQKANAEGFVPFWKGLVPRSLGRLNAPKRLSVARTDMLHKTLSNDGGEGLGKLNFLFGDKPQVMRNAAYTRARFLCGICMRAVFTCAVCMCVGYF